MPLAREAVNGEAPGLKPEAALEALFHTQFYPERRIQPAPDSDAEAVVDFLVEMLPQEDEEIRRNIAGLISDAAVAWPERRAELVDVVAEVFVSDEEDDYDYREAFNRYLRGEGEPISHGEYLELSSMSESKLVDIFVDPINNRVKQPHVAFEILRERLEDSPTALESISKLLARSDVRGQYQLFPNPIGLDATEEQREVHDFFLNYCRNALRESLGDDGQRLDWIVRGMRHMAGWPWPDRNRFGSSSVPESSGVYGVAAAASILIEVAQSHSSLSRPIALRTVGEMAWLGREEAREIREQLLTFQQTLSTSRGSLDAREWEALQKACSRAIETTEKVLSTPVESASPAEKVSYVFTRPTVVTWGAGGVPSPKEHSEGPDSISLDYAEQWTAFLAKVEPLFGTREKRRGLLYRMVVESLDKESVPFLRELLQDESFKDRWIEIGRMIAWLSDSDDEESVSAIIAYIRRPNTWPTDDRDSILDDAVGKGAVLQALGLFESDIVSETLRDAFTEEGAAELIAPWVSIQTTVEPLYLAFIIRSWAAKGLVLTRDPENIALVRESYEALAHKMLTPEYREKEMTDEMWLDSERHLAFMGAMTDNDMLTEMGVEEFMRLRDNSEKWARTTLRFASMYWGNYLDDERTVMEQCPVCGKVAE